MLPNIAFVPCSTENLTFVPCSLFLWDKCHFPLFPKTPGRDSIMWIPYLAIYLPGRIKKRQIDNWFANKRMVGRKLEMSTRSGSNYLTLAGKSRFWYQVAPGGGGGALRPGFMCILVLQSSWWRSGSSLLCLVCLPGVSWLLCGSSSRCNRFVFGLYLWYFLIKLTIFDKTWIWIQTVRACTHLAPITLEIRHWRFACGPIVARDGMLAWYSCNLVMVTK